jgi:subtilisin family serine protease
MGLVLTSAIGALSQPPGRADLDLVVKAITIAPASPKPGEELTVTATVLNQGKGDVEGSFNVQLLVSLGPPEFSAIGFGELGGLQVGVQRLGGGLRAGQEKEVQFRWRMIALPLAKLRVVADAPFDNVPETDEGNNALEAIVRVESRYLDQWWLERIDAPGAWALTQGSPEVVVAVIDSGLDWAHPELAGAIWTNPREIPANGLDDDGNGFIDDLHGWDFVDYDNDSLHGSPLEPHGTAVAALIAGAADGKGTTGVAPGVKLMDLRVLDRRGEGRWADAFKAIEYAIANGAAIVNMSFSSPYSEEDEAWFNRHLEPLLERARKQGLILVASAGNEAGKVGWPARSPHVIAVSATTKADEAASYSNFGPEVEFAAPGGSLSWEQLKAALARARSLEDVLPVVGDLLITPWPGEYYGWFAGTSASAPIVSGAIALLRSLKPDLSLEQVREILKATATDLGEPGKDERFGFGLINAAAAVRHLAAAAGQER